MRYILEQAGLRDRASQAERSRRHRECQLQDPPTCKIIKTGKGHTLQFEDADGQTVLLYNATEKLLLVMDSKGVRVTDANRKHKVTLEDSGVTVTDGVNGNKLVMDSSGITVSGPGGAVVIGTSGVSIGGSSATEPLVLGNSLMLALNTHTHVGNLGAPTSPPVVPPHPGSPVAQQQGAVGGIVALVIGSVAADSGMSKAIYDQVDNLLRLRCRRPLTRPPVTPR